MKAYTNNLALENGPVFGFNLDRVLIGKRYTTHTNGVARLGKNLKNVALFFAAPFIGLAYLLAFPVIGLAMIAWIGVKAAMKNDNARRIATLIAAPFIALAFVTVGPIVGLGGLAWVGATALAKG